MSIEALSFARNTLLYASAGTGKTHTLTSLYLKLILGETDLNRQLPRPTSVSRIVAVTFTEKAASEMRARIASALHRHDAEPARQAARQFHQARITTFHSLCASLLRTYAREAAVDPHFELLDDIQAEQRIERSLLQSMERHLDHEDPALRQWLLEHGGLGRDLDTGLLRSLTKLMQHESASDESNSTTHRGHWNQAERNRLLQQAIRQLGLVGSVDTPEDTPEACAHAAHQLISSHLELVHAENLHHSTRRTAQKVADYAAHLASKPCNYTTDWYALHAMVRAFESTLGASKARELEPAASVRHAVHTIWTLREEQHRARVLHGVLDEARHDYETQKRIDAVLDFDDLMRRTRDLLRDNARVRQHVVRSMDALLVDEFQDTNRIQKELVFLLRSASGGEFSGERKVPRSHEILPHGLFVVGDRKQSIYAFRGADISVFDEVAREMRDQGSSEHSLQTSYRSQARLVEAINFLSRATFADTTAREMTNTVPMNEGPALSSTHDDHSPYDPGKDDLQSVHPPATRPSVDILGWEHPSSKHEQARTPVQSEAHAIAQHIRRLLHPIEDGDRVLVRETRGAEATDPPWRPPHAGDIALLLPRFTHLTHYTRALDAAGIPYTVVRGRGLLDTIEAHDLLALSRLLTRTHDDRDLVAWLRGPYVTLADTTLTRIARADDFTGWQAWWQSPALPPGTDAAQTDRLDHAMRVLRHARVFVHTRGLSYALERMIDELAVLHVYARTTGGQQRVANARKLLAEAHARELAGEDPILIVQAWTRHQRQGQPIAEAEVPTDSQVVQLMTVHQAKGLQFPIVFAADLGWGVTQRKEPIDFDPHPAAGLSMAVKASPLDEWAYSPHADTVARVKWAKNVQERKRLFYVQMTRARDHLVLSCARAQEHSIWKWVIEPHKQELYAQGLAREVAAEHVSGTHPAQPPSCTETACTTFQPTTPLSEHELQQPHLPQDASQSAPQSWHAPLQPMIRFWEFNVTELGNFSHCPRRYMLKHEIAVPEAGHSSDSSVASGSPLNPSPQLEPPSPMQKRGVSTDGDVTSRNATLWGTWAHAALERVRLDHVQADPTHALEEALQAAPAWTRAPLADRILPFLRGHYLTHHLTTGATLQREVPFALRCTRANIHVLVRGQIDFWIQHSRGIDIIDYKTARTPHPDDLEPYRFQLQLYAAAMQRAHPDTLIRAGIQYLDGTSQQPVWLDPLHLPSDEDIVTLAEQLLRSRAQGDYEGREKHYCDRIRCGYRRLCHATQTAQREHL